MSASLTERRAYFMASSKWARVMQGTSSTSSSMLSGLSASRFSRSISFSMFSLHECLMLKFAHSRHQHRARFFMLRVRQPQGYERRWEGGGEGLNTGPHLMAYLQALWQISVMSAPEKPLVYLTSWLMSTSGATGDLRRAAMKICFLLGSSGRGM